MKMRRGLSLALIAVALSAGCAGEAESYDDVSALAEAVAGEGVACERTDPLPRARLVSDGASCEGSSTTLYVFQDADALADWKKVGARLGAVAAGPNWAVTGDRADVERVAAGLGGEMVVAE